MLNNRDKPRCKLTCVLIGIFKKNTSTKLCIIVKNAGIACSKDSKKIESLISIF